MDEFGEECVPYLAPLVSRRGDRRRGAARCLALLPHAPRAIALFPSFLLTRPSCGEPRSRNGEGF
jgi:hypothetical protein